MSIFSPDYWDASEGVYPKSPILKSRINEYLEEAEHCRQAAIRALDHETTMRYYNLWIAWLEIAEEADALPD